MKVLVSNKEKFVVFLATVLLSSITIFSQSTGVPSTIRVLTDANGSILVKEASQVAPVSQPTQFSNTRLTTDADGNLQVVLVGGGGGGGGTPGGATNAIQFKIDASTFGGSNWLADSSNILFRPSNYLTENGPFRIRVDSASHGVGERRDDIFSLGWNTDNTVAAGGGNSLVFEAFCGTTVGCSATGQSETYFSVNDGQSHSSRPIGIFQLYDGTGTVNGIFRFNGLSFFDRDQSYQIFSVADNSGTGAIRTYTSPISSDITSGNAFTINGQGALGFGSSAVQIGLGGSNVTLSGGGDGSAIVKVNTNHFQMLNPVIEDATGQALVRFSSDGPFIRFDGHDGDGEFVMSPGSGAANFGLNITPKGDGSIRLNTQDAGAGAVYFQTANIKVGTFPGAAGITASGTTCTITAITAGIITGASCTP